MDQAGQGRLSSAGKRNQNVLIEGVEKLHQVSASQAILRSELSFETQKLLPGSRSFPVTSAVHASSRNVLQDNFPCSETEREFLLNKISILENELKEAQQENTANKNYLANLSHEIRNSVNTIVGMTSLLHDEVTTQKPQKYLSHLKQASDLLLAMMTNALELGKMDRGQIEPSLENFDLVALLNSLAKTTEFRLWEKPVHFKYYLSPELPTNLLGDKVLLYQILLNLLGNAIKFTENGQISFSVEPIAIKSNICWVSFNISDTGIGFSPKVKAQIFKRFEQSGQAKYRQQGAGLGLAISKNILDLLGGNIEVESELGKGSSFTVQLPFRINQEASVETKQVLNFAPVATVGLKRILVVEDNPLNQAYLQAVLEKMGYEVSCVDTGLKATEKLDQESFDLAFIDLRIPLKNGFETCIHLRNSAAMTNRTIPVVATSGSTSLADHEKAKAVGMDDYLTKPFSPKDIYAVLQKYESRYVAQRTPASFQFSPVFDQSRLQELYMDNYDQVKLMFDIFLKNTPNSFAQIENQWETGDWLSLNDSVHKIKPTFTMVGLNYVSNIAKQLEDQSQQTQRASRMKESFQRFKAAVLESVHLVASEKKKLEEFQFINP
ncbi:MAG: response regulator [Saprospiraceae bacterium]|nr:response regulator [Saprospiraceae bacterium]